MKSEDLINQARRLSAAVTRSRSVGDYTQACEFLRTFAGPKSTFYEQVHSVMQAVPDYRARTAESVLLSFAEYIKAGLIEEITPERKAQLDVVSDLLDQANSLLSDTKVHPAAPAVLIGATLEEFLRTWVEKEGISLGNKKPSMDSYAKILRESDLIDKQDVKDITAWAGIRNDAAHGKWDKVENSEKISLMLQGVNLFLRKHGSE